MKNRGSAQRRGLRGALVALSTAVAAATAITAAANAGTARRAGTTVNRTLSCTTAAGALRISAFAEVADGQGASAGIGTGTQAANKWLVAVDTRYKNYESDVCHTVKTRVAFTHRGLTSAGISSAGQYNGPPTVYCAAAAHVLLRFRIAFDSSDTPAQATMAVWTQPKKKTLRSKAITFVQWSPKRSVTYYSPACTIG